MTNSRTLYKTILIVPLTKANLGNMTRIPTFFLMAFLWIGSAKANLVLNPSFESPDLAMGFQDFVAGSTIGSGWIVESASEAATVIKTPYTNFTTWPDATDGDQILYLGQILGSTTIRQDIGLAANTQYSLEFDLANFTNNQANGNGAYLEVDILLGGASVTGGPVDFTRPFNGGFETQSHTFSTTSGGDYRLLLTSQNGFGTNIDNFQLRAVPEPSSFLLLGLVAIGFLVSRHNVFYGLVLTHLNRTCETHT